MKAQNDILALYQRLPLDDLPLLQGRAPYYFDWLAHPTLDEYWRTLVPEELYEPIAVPALTIAAGTISSRKKTWSIARA